MAYRHGIYVREQETGLSAPMSGTAGLQVVIGTAPVYLTAHPEQAVNVPILVSSFSEAAEAVGFLRNFKKYTLCEAVSAAFEVVNVAPLVLINVLDPKKHVSELEETEVSVSGGVAVVERDGVLLEGLVVKSGAEALEKGVDYEAAYNDAGALTIALLGDTAAEKLTVSGKVLDASLVTAEDILGAVDKETGKETGMEVIRQVYPKLGMTPGILCAPRFSADAKVSAALQAKCRDINGIWRCVCIVDIDSGAEGAKTYADVKAQKEKQGLNDPACYAVWGYGKVGTALYSGSALAAALTAYTDAENGDIPYVSPSNRQLSVSAMALEGGTEVLLDLEQANTVNAFGVATLLNMNGFRLWGNRTCAYPERTDAKDTFFSCRRYMLWRANSFILSYFSRVDSPMNLRLIEAVVDSENIRGNSYVAIGAAARDEIRYSEEENTASALAEGRIVFHQYMTPYPPAEDIEDIIEFDPSALSDALG